MGGLAVSGLARRRTSSLRRNAFGSSGSGFFGPQTYAAFSLTPSSEGNPHAQGVASMTMRQLWWIKNSGYDNRGNGKLFDWKRRESYRRGDEDYLNDMDNFELLLHNLRPPPGQKKHRVRGRGRYGSRGRSCGVGVKSGPYVRGANKRNRGYMGGMQPIQKTTPKLTREQRLSVAFDHHLPIKLSVLNELEDGAEVDFEDLFLRGLDVEYPRGKCQVWGAWKWGTFAYRYKVKGKDTDDFNVKNLTVYAHAFEPAAKEKIEELGGRCIRLHKYGGIPVDGYLDAMDASKVTTIDEGEEPEES